MNWLIIVGIVIVIILLIVLVVYWFRPLPLADIRSRCATNADCGSGFFCGNGGVCQAGSGNVGDVCTTDLTCRTGLKCVNGVCRNGTQNVIINSNPVGSSPLVQGGFPGPLGGVPAPVEAQSFQNMLLAYNTPGQTYYLSIPEGMISVLLAVPNERFTYSAAEHRLYVSYGDNKCNNVTVTPCGRLTVGPASTFTIFRQSNFPTSNAVVTDMYGNQLGIDNNFEAYFNDPRYYNRTADPSWRAISFSIQAGF